VIDPEKPCPWHAESVNEQTGRLEVIFCEVGPAGHEGTHIGERSRAEYRRLFSIWRRHEIKKLREKNEST
jgi:hypothetical protein